MSEQYCSLKLGAELIITWNKPVSLLSEFAQRQLYSLCARKFQTRPRLDCYQTWRCVLPRPIIMVIQWDKRNERSERQVGVTGRGLRIHCMVSTDYNMGAMGREANERAQGHTSL